MKYNLFNKHTFIYSVDAAYKTRGYEVQSFIRLTTSVIKFKFRKKL